MYHIITYAIYSLNACLSAFPTCACSLLMVTDLLEGFDCTVLPHITHSTIPIVLALLHLDQTLPRPQHLSAL